MSMSSSIVAATSPLRAPLSTNDPGTTSASITAISGPNTQFRELADDIAAQRGS